MKKIAFRPPLMDPVPAAPVFAPFRRKALKNFEDQGMPSRKDEAWRLTPLKILEDLKWDEGSVSSSIMPEITEEKGIRLVFFRGLFVEDASKLGESSDLIRVMPMSRALVEFPETLLEHMGSLSGATPNPFVALNSSRNLEGVLIHISPELAPSTAIEILHLGGGEGTAVYPRMLVLLEEKSSATILERFDSEAAAFSCPLTEIVLKRDARLEYSRVVEESGSAVHMGNVFASLQAGADFDFLSAGLGAKLFRLETTIQLLGRGAGTKISGLTLSRDTQHGEHVLRVEHQAPECVSHQNFRSILNDSGRAVFTGRIVVAPDAQKTDAAQSSRSLLLSPKAVVYNNPQLEIDADDVRCTHGSTVGELDEEALFYLRSRGIDRKEARRMLTLAFADEILQSIHSDDLRKGTQRQVLAWLEGGNAS